MNLKQRLTKLEAERPHGAKDGSAFDVLSIEELTALYNAWKHNLTPSPELEAMTLPDLTAFYFRTIRGPA